MKLADKSDRQHGSRFSSQQLTATINCNDQRQQQVAINDLKRNKHQEREAITLSSESTKSSIK
jgi:hypothetical protein